MEVNQTIIAKSIEHYGKEKQSVVCMEELAELTQCISKELRGKSDKEHLTEEIADVTICLEMLKQMYEISEELLGKMIRIKQQRILDRMDKKQNKCKWEGYGGYYIKNPHTDSYLYMGNRPRFCCTCGKEIIYD